MRAPLSLRPRELVPLTGDAHTTAALFSEALAAEPVETTGLPTQPLPREPVPLSAAHATLPLSRWRPSTA